MLHALKPMHCLKTCRQLMLTNPPIWVHPLIKYFASLAPSSEVCSKKLIAKVVFSGKVLATLPVRIWNNVNTYLVYNSPSDSHAIKDSNINNSWHPSIIYGLRTIGPHVGAFSQVNIAWTQTTAGQRRENLKRKKLTIYRRTCHYT